MAINQEIPINVYNGDGVTVEFTGEFTVATGTDLAVYVDAVKKSESTDYTITGLGTNPFSVTFTTPPATGSTVLLKRIIDYNRLNDYQEGGDLLADTLDGDLDRIVSQMQQLAAIIDPDYSNSTGRALAAPIDGIGGVFSKSDFDNRQSTIVGYNSNKVLSLYPQTQAAVAIQTYHKTSDYASVEAMVSSLVGGPHDVIIDGNISCTTDCTIPATIRLIGSTGTIDVATGKTLTINGAFDAGLYQVFSGSGSVVFGNGVVKEVYPEWWGAIGDGATDSKISVQSALNSYTHVQLNGIYAVNNISIPANRVIRTSNKRNGFIKNGNNPTIASIGDRSVIYDATISGNGTNYTGNNINIITGFSQRLSNCEVSGSKGSAIVFSADAGGGFVMDGGAFNTAESMFPAGIIAGAGDTNIMLRVFSNVWGSGSYYDFSGAMAHSVIGGFCNNVITDNSTNSLRLVGVNIDTFTPDGATIIVRGNNHAITGCTIASPLVRFDCQGVSFSGNIGFSGIEEASTALSNSIDSWQPRGYTLLWSQDSGAQPSFGNSTVVSFFRREGNKCNINIKIIFGTTATFGNSSNVYKFSLPVKSTSAILQRFPIGKIVSVNSGVIYELRGAVEPNENTFSLSTSLYSGIRSDVPAVWASGDTLEINFDYITG